MNSLKFFTDYSAVELCRKLDMVRQNYETYMYNPAHYYLRICKEKEDFSLCFSLGHTHTLWKFSFKTPGEINLTRKKSFYHYMVSITLLLIDIFIFWMVGRNQVFAGVILFLLLVIGEFVPYYLLEFVFARKRIRRFVNEILLKDI